MDLRAIRYIDTLACQHSLPPDAYEYLVSHYDQDIASHASLLADAARKKHFGNKVYTRGLIEVSNYCVNNCNYCGIRAGNKTCQRYRLSDSDILACVDEGYDLGFRTVVLQGGEDPAFTDQRVCTLIEAIKQSHPDMAVTLSLGERTRKSYQALFDAGADRYLLRHESASKQHYQRIHPVNMSYDNRMECLRTLREVGYVVGCGFMVGSPFQDAACLALDLAFIEQFKPEMCGIGPFVPHHATPYANKPQGSVELTCFLLSLLRLIHPTILLPATTALGTIDPLGREKGIQAGANVVMPNLSPAQTREKYELYDNKICTGEESAQCRAELESRMRAIGYQLAVDRGDPPGWKR